MNKSFHQPLGLSYRATLRQSNGRWKIGPIVMLRDFLPPPPFLAPYFQIFASWRRGGGRGAHYSTLRSVRENFIPFSGIVAWKDCLRFDQYANSQIQMHLKEQPLNCSQSEIFHLDWGRRRFSFCVESDNAEIKKVLIFSVRPSVRPMLHASLPSTRDGQICVGCSEEMEGEKSEIINGTFENSVAFL